MRCFSSGLVNIAHAITEEDGHSSGAAWVASWAFIWGYQTTMLEERGAAELLKRPTNIVSYSDSWSSSDVATIFYFSSPSNLFTQGAHVSSGSKGGPNLGCHTFPKTTLLRPFYGYEHLGIRMRLTGRMIKPRFRVIALLKLVDMCPG